MFKGNFYKKGLQWLIIAMLGYMVVRLFVDPDYIADFEAYCPVGGMQAFASFLVNDTLACSMTETQIFMGIMLIAGVVIFAKLFCSYICPLGTFTEWLGKIGDKFNACYTISGFADRALRILKYGLLFATFYFSVKTSELFCKTFDPYYAAFTGFGYDVVFWYAFPALLITIAGAVFIRQFWCKYLCPLGAATNVFTYAIPVAGVIAVFLLLNAIGLEISWIWQLAAISILGFILESVRLKGWIFPPLKITRHASTCTACISCDLACPMGLEISTVHRVEHIDCHLCGECLYACPEIDTLQINRRERKWLPASATVTMFLIGILLANTVELPTINIRWGEEQKLEAAAIYSHSGLKNVKCYGSSMSFASKMKQVPGVLGVETYVQSHTVKVFYDPQELTAEELKQSLFTPSKTMLKVPEEETDPIAVLGVGIDKLFDSFDIYYLTQKLAQTEGVYGFSTEFGEPVHAKIYYSPEKVSSERLKEVIEEPELTYTNRGKAFTVGVNFQVVHTGDTLPMIGKDAFFKALFDRFNISFNEYERRKRDELAVYRIPMPQAADAALRRSLMSLVSHVSADSSIVRFQTIYTDQPYAEISYLKDKISEDRILKTLRTDTMTVHYRNGKTGRVLNPFKFPHDGLTIVSPENLIIREKKK